MPYVPPSLSNFNASPPSDDGSKVESNSLEWARDIVAKIGTPLKTFAEAINTAVKNRFDVTPDYSETAAETTASVTIVDSQKKPGNVLRYGTNTIPGTTDMSVALQAASDSNGFVFIPDGTYLHAAGWVPPNEVRIEGESKRGTILKYTGSGTAVKLGTSDSVLNVGCAIRHLSVKPEHKDAKAIVLNATNGAFVEAIYIEGLATPFDNTRTSVGVTIDGRNISSFFNTIKDVNVAHCHMGYELGTTGTTQATTTDFINCQAFCDVATDNSGVGIKIDNSGDGASWYGGNLEQCATAIQMTANARPMTFFGARFEANTVDILFDSGAETSNFIGLLDFLFTKVTNNSGNSQQFIGCNQASLVSYTEIPRLLYTKPIENVTTTNVITAAESGTTYYLNAAGGFTSTLPVPADGLHYTFIVRTAPSSGNYVITTDAGANALNGMYLDVVGELVSFNAMDTLNFISGTSLQSDRLEVECDGNTWHCMAFSKVDGGITVSAT